MSRVWLFLTSLAPALLIASVRFIPNYPILGSTATILSLLLCLSAYLFITARKKLEKNLIHIQAVKDESFQIPTYLITFIFPFLFIDTSPDWATTVAYGLFLCLIGLLIFRTNLSLVNPVLLIAGYKIYESETESQTTSLVISKFRPIPGVTYSSYSLYTGIDLLVSTAKPLENTNS